MIRVNIKKEKNFITGFNISGHAEYSEFGSDIVCAAVSMLTFNTIDAFTDILLISEYLDINIFENHIEVYRNVCLSSDDERDFQLLMKKYELGIKSLIQSYGDYIELNYTEV